MLDKLVPPQIVDALSSFSSRIFRMFRDAFSKLGVIDRFITLLGGVIIGLVAGYMICIFFDDQRIKNAEYVENNAKSESSFCQAQLKSAFEEISKNRDSTKEALAVNEICKSDYKELNNKCSYFESEQQKKIDFYQKKTESISKKPAEHFDQLTEEIRKIAERGLDSGPTTVLNGEYALTAQYSESENECVITMKSTTTGSAQYIKFSSGQSKQIRFDKKLVRFVFIEGNKFGNKSYCQFSLFY